MQGDWQVRDVEYDPAASEFRGTVMVSGPSGVALARVATAGPPGWGHARACAALAEAGRHALLANRAERAARPEDA